MVSPTSYLIFFQAVKLIVEDALLKFSADRTGLPDYALESAGTSGFFSDKIGNACLECTRTVFIVKHGHIGFYVTVFCVRWEISVYILFSCPYNNGLICLCSGGSVISVRCSETYYRKTALISIFGIPLWYTSNSARTVIQVRLFNFVFTCILSCTAMEVLLSAWILCHWLWLTYLYSRNSLMIYAKWSAWQRGSEYCIKKQVA